MGVMSSFVRTFRNFKIELMVGLVFITAFMLGRLNVQSILSIESNMPGYFTAGRMEGITSFFSITIGIYIAVIMILATSVLGISKEMLKKGTDKTLINVMIGGMVENIIVVGLCIFLDVTNIYLYYLLSLTTLVGIISFFKFIYYVLLISRANMVQTAKNIDEEDKYKEAILTHIEEIGNQMKKNKR